MPEFFARGAPALALAREACAGAGSAEAWPRHAIGAVALKAPIGRPPKIVCIGMNYVDHCTEQNFPIPTEPVIFNKFPTTINDPGAPILMPPETQELDFEVELAIVVGKGGHRIPVERAMEHVAGFTVAHDVSARDWQLKKNAGQWLLGKTFNTFSPIGPSIVTPDDAGLGDVHKQPISLTVNGVTMQSSNTDQLIFKTDRVVSWCSKFFSLEPGDLIFTGTPPGVGCFRKPPVWLKPGDVCTCTIGGLGSITNTVVLESNL